MALLVKHFHNPISEFSIADAGYLHDMEDIYDMTHSAVNATYVLRVHPMVNNHKFSYIPTN